MKKAMVPFSHFNREARALNVRREQLQRVACACVSGRPRARACVYITVSNECGLSHHHASPQHSPLQGGADGTLRDMCLSVCWCHYVTVWGFFWTLVGLGVMAVSPAVSGVIPRTPQRCGQGAHLARDLGHYDKRVPNNIIYSTTMQ